MKSFWKTSRWAIALLSLSLNMGCHESSSSPSTAELVADGKEIFRYDTFGDEQQWTQSLQMNEVIPTLSPNTLLSLGIKVDSEALPVGILASADLDDPATTLALIDLDAVVGVVGTVEGDELTEVGITCAFCHSTVDDSLAAGVGERLDGWPNLDLNVGAIIAASPAMQDPDIQQALLSWGPGKYDARFNQDGLSDPAVIPPAYGLADVEIASFTGDGDISYWNSYVAITQMGGQGVFSDPRIGVNIQELPDLVTGKLRALKEYQHSLAAPAPPENSFDEVAASRGELIFYGKAECGDCHSGPAFTDEELKLADAIGTDPLHAARSATGRYRTTPLRALWQHAPYFHDGSAASLMDVVEHYDSFFSLNLTQAETSDLVEFLRSI